jgi:lipopolysaccharide heptosyltransferase II
MMKDGCGGRDKKILILALQGIGDTLLSFPMIKSLQNYFPESSIDVTVANQECYELVKINRNINKIIRIDISWKNIPKAISQVRKDKYDIAIVTFPPGRKNDLLMCLIQARIKIGIPDRRLIGKLFTNVYSRRIEPTYKTHDKDENLRMIQYLGIDPNYSLQPTLDISDFDNSYATQYLKDKRVDDNDLLIGIQPGSGDAMPCKRWPAGSFARLADILISRYNAKLILFGGKDNNELLSNISLLMEKKPYLICGEKLVSVCGIIKKCNLFISNDTGLMHVAAAVGTPVVAIFGATDPKRTGPCGIGHMIIKSGVVCSPCHTLKTAHFNKCPKGTNECMKSISVEQVLKAVENQLNPDPKIVNR